MSPALVLQLGYLAYLIVVVVFVVSENRTPKATFAWILSFALLPGLGLLIYLFVGRGHRAFIRRPRRRKKRREQDLADERDEVMRTIRREHDVALRAMGPREARIVSLIHSNANSYLHLQNKVTLLQDATEVYPAMMEAIRGAQSSIHLHYYSWNADSFGTRLLVILRERAAAGVEVRILYDPVGSFSTLSRRYLRRARAEGIEIKPFSALWRFHTISYRNHRKIAVIDGRIGFTGGLNIGDEHLDPPLGFTHWRDTHIRVEGTAVWPLQSTFLTDWANATGQDLDEELYFALPDETVAEAHLPVQVCLSGPDSEYEAIRQLYFELITSAESEVLIQSPFFILDETVSEALKLAAMSGIDVKVMISSAGPKQWLPYWAANTYAADVARAGVKVFLYEGGYLHAKTICVDGSISSVGSANWDIRSFSINYELTAVIYDREIGRKLGEAFEADLAMCRPFDPAEYAERRHLLRFRDSVARLASPLL